MNIVVENFILITHCCQVAYNNFINNITVYKHTLQFTLDFCGNISWVICTFSLFNDSGMLAVLIFCSKSTNYN